MKCPLKKSEARSRQYSHSSSSKLHDSQAMEMKLCDRMKTLRFEDIQNWWNSETCLFFLTHSTKTQKHIQITKTRTITKRITPAQVRKTVCARLRKLIQQRVSSGITCHPNRPLELLMISSLNHQIAIIGCLLPMQPMPLPLQFQEEDDFHHTLLRLLTFMRSLKTVVNKQMSNEASHDNNNNNNASLPRIELPLQWPEFMLPKSLPPPPTTSTTLITEEHMCILPTF
jgi:hypothetical protein